MRDNSRNPVPFSPAAALAWKIAMAEALLAGSESIEKEHLFIGLCSLDKLLTIRDLFRHGTVARRVLYERDAIDYSLKTPGLDPAIFRRGVRRMLHRGKRPVRKGIIHRSPDCRKYFDRAREIAQGKEITCIHLMDAILENPGPVIEGIMEPMSPQPGETNTLPITVQVIRSLHVFEKTKRQEQHARAAITRSRHTLESLPSDSGRTLQLRKQVAKKTIRVARLCLALGDLAGLVSALRELAEDAGAGGSGICALCAQIDYMRTEGIVPGVASKEVIDALMSEREREADRGEDR